MLTIREILFSVVLPAAAAGIVVIAAWRVRSLRASAAAFAALSAYLVAHIGIIGLPNLPPTPGTQGVAWAGVLGLVAGALLERAKMGRIARLATRVSCAALACLGIGWRKLTRDEAWTVAEAAAWFALIVGVCVFWVLLERVIRRCGAADESREGLDAALLRRERWAGGGAALVIAMNVGTTVPIIIIVGGVMVLGQLLDAMALGLVIAAAAGFAWRMPASPRRLSAVVAMLAGSLWMAAVLLAELPVWIALGHCVSPAAALIADVGLFARRRAWIRVIVRVVAVVLAVMAVGGVPAIREFADHAEEYGA